VGEPEVISLRFTTLGTVLIPSEGESSDR
jgi:hypothetical protein